MLSDRTKIDYAKKVLRPRYLGAPQTTGLLTAGKYYIVADLKSGDDFRNLGASCNREDLIFKATGTTPTVWTNGSALIEWKLDDLKALAESTFNSATDPVTITSGSFEGGQGQGQITFEKAILGVAIAELIDATDPGYRMPDLPSREIGFTVRLDC
jgi:hypothetical protein